MKKNYLISLFTVLMLLLTLNSCTKDVEEIVISDDKQIDELMEIHNLKSFLAILDKSEMRSTVHAYGNYALFAPTDDAVAAYIKQVGKASVDDLSKEEAVEIVKYHLLNITNKSDSLTTTGFVD